MTVLQNPNLVMEYCYLTDRKFKIASFFFMKKLNETQENSERQFNKLRNKNNEQRNVYTYGWFMLFDRKQQNSVKQLSFNQK